MEGGDFYEDIFKKKNLALGYMKQLEAAVAPDVLINIRTNYLMTCTKTSYNLTGEAELSKRKRLSLPEVNTNLKKPVGIKADNLSEEEDAESDEDGLDLPDKVKFEIFSDSEHEESSNEENPAGEEPKSKRLCRRKPTSKNLIPSEIKIEIEEAIDSNLIETEESYGDFFPKEILENIFKHLPLTDLLNFRTVSTDWDKKIIFHMDKNNRLRHVDFGNREIQELISLVKSSKHIPFTKFDLEIYSFIKEDLEELFKICGSSVKHLSINVSDFTDKFSRFFPNLESLHLDGSLESNAHSESDDSDTDDEMIAPIVFSKLTDVKYNVETEIAAKVFPTFWKFTPNLNRFEVRNADPVFEKKIITDITNAGSLANITKLHLDTLKGSTFNILFKAASTTGLFFKEFCVKKIDEKIDLDHLSEFLSTQGKSLKKLEILTTFETKKDYMRKPSQISDDFRYVLNAPKKFHNLKLKSMIALSTLSFQMENDGLCPQTENALEDLPNLDYVTIPEIYECFAQSLSLQLCCPTVTKLVLNTSICGKKCEQLGIMFPSVKSLEFKEASPECVEIVTTVWPALKHLKLMGIENRLNYNLDEIQIYFPTLVKLKGLETLSIWDWSSYTMKERFFVRFKKGSQFPIPATSKNAIPSEIKIEIEEPTEFSGNFFPKVIMENIFQHLPVDDLLNFRVVSTDWDKQIICHLDKKNRLCHLSFVNRNINEFISLVKSSKHIPFTKFNLVATRPHLKRNMRELLTVCGPAIKHLSIYASDFTDKLSRFLPNLESLDVDESLINNSDSESARSEDQLIAPIVFTKLTDIKYNFQLNPSSGYRFASCRASARLFPTFFESTPNLNRLKVDSSGSEKYIVTNLVSAGRLANITKMDLKTLGESAFQSLASTTGLFLEEFCVNYLAKEIDLDDFSEFISTQGKSLKKLAIQTNSQPRNFENVPNFQNLKLNKMIALTSLSFHMANNGIQTENALEDLPNLVEVTIPNISSSLAQSLSLRFSCPTATKLVVEKVVHVKKTCKQNVIKALGIMFPSVKSLKFFEALPQHVEDVTSAWLALKHLKINFSRYHEIRLMKISNIDEIHSFFPSLVKLKDLKTLLIFKTTREPMEQLLFVRFGKDRQSTIFESSTSSEYGSGNETENYIERLRTRQKKD